MAYQPIENHGVIGDLRTIALVAVDGTIDWFCFPAFDAPSVFAAILDDRKGGRFAIAPTSTDITRKQFYWPESNVLITRFLSPDGVGQITDFMPVGLRVADRQCHQLVRRVQVIRGTMAFRVVCTPAFNYGRDPHDTRILDTGARFDSPGLRLALGTRQALTAEGDGVTAEFTLGEGQSSTFVFGHADGEHPVVALSEPAGEDLQSTTVDYWRHWLSKCTYQGRWREIVHRSALALKLLTYEPTGAIVASPTTSLPEAVGGERNWDYRYTWIRDAAFTIYGLMRIGFTDAAGQFMGWLENRCNELNPDGSLQVMYGLDGRHDLPEQTLDHLEGYRGSRPVRIGNGAQSQLQLDIYGALMDSVYLYNKYGSPISYDLWRHLRRLINWVCDNWRRKDEGIWEVRNSRQSYVYSKLMCWVAVDRGLRLAHKRSFPADLDRWMRVRNEIYEEIMDRGWNPARGAFRQFYGGESLDAANLMMPLVLFLSPSDPRTLQNLAATMQPPEQGGLVSNSLVYRYNLDHTVDGLSSREGTFNMCTFWLVEALTRAGHRDRPLLAKSRLIFEEMLGHANHLRLYAEETGPSGEALGNFPQGLTHLALISAAFNLDRALGRRGE